MYAVIIKRSIFVPGDQRSKDYPGHGYPDHYVESSEFKEFKTERELLQWLNLGITCHRIIQFEELELKRNYELKPKVVSN